LLWHGHKNCRDAKNPKTIRNFGKPKLKRSAKRQKNIESLLKLGWNVLTIWECQLQKDKLKSTLSDIVNKLVE